MSGIKYIIILKLHIKFALTSLFMVTFFDVWNQIDYCFVVLHKYLLGINAYEHLLNVWYRTGYHFEVAYKDFPGIIANEHFQCLESTDYQFDITKVP
ncbi:hypothetical protein CEXT_714391 [Caerostris extrusa]|uniref:Uncharacterized protein n=1 Tax=Caerostris extrusa TaxID=172846 RepID=A0AAV4U133_CAEEX|nr:hypothetical protein CEXT_714391 [Caerostris extrusa]